MGIFFYSKRRNTGKIRFLSLFYFFYLHHFSIVLIWGKKISKRPTPLSQKKFVLMIQNTFQAPKIKKVILWILLFLGQVGREYIALYWPQINSGLTPDFA